MFERFRRNRDRQPADIYTGLRQKVLQISPEIFHAAHGAITQLRLIEESRERQRPCQPIVPVGSPQG